MTDFLEQIGQTVESSTLGFSLGEASLILGLSFVLTVCVGFVYRATHSGRYYSAAYVQTLVLMGTVVSLIILIVGSNVARAFAMVGALSIVRFRNAMKETRDLGFIFMSMAIGMAVGTRAYALAVFITVGLCLIVGLMHGLKLFQRSTPAYRLQVRLPVEMDAEKAFAVPFAEALKHWRLLSLETVRAGVLQEASYEIVLKPGLSAQPLLDQLRQYNGNQKIVLWLAADQETADD